MSKAESIDFMDYTYDNGVFRYDSEDTAKDLFQELADEEKYSTTEPVEDTEIVYSGRIRLRREATRHENIIITESEQMEEKLEELSEKHLEE